MSAIISMLNRPDAASIVDSIGVLLWCVMVSTLLCELSGRTVRWGRCVVHALLITASILAFDRGIEAFMKAHSLGRGSMRWVFVYSMRMFRTPIWLIVIIPITVCALRIPWKAIQKQIVVIFCAYQLSECIGRLLESAFWCVVSLLGIEFSPTNAIMVYFFLFSELLTAVFLVLLLSGWIGLRRYIRTKRHVFKLFAENIEDAKAVGNVLSISQLAILWVVIMGYAMTNDISDAASTLYIQLAYSIALIVIHALVIFLHYYLRLRNQQSKYLMESNRMMIEAIDNFRSIKHDFNNILHTYDGYFALEDYEGLRRYHEVLRGKTVMAGDSLSLQMTFDEAPGILGVLLNAMENAESAGVSFDCVHVDALKRVSMPVFDLCRMLGILLNNAIEHAKHTKIRTVGISVRAQPNGKAVIIISNSVDGKINTTDLFKEGYTTKAGHMGHGLAEVNRILADHFGCTILPNCTEDMFSMYVETPLEPERAQDAAKDAAKNAAQTGKTKSDATG